MAQPNTSRLRTPGFSASVENSAITASRVHAAWTNPKRVSFGPGGLRTRQTADPSG
jgi:hypothetical protein